MKFLWYASALLALVDVRCIAQAEEDCVVQEDGTVVCDDGEVYLDDDDFDDADADAADDQQYGVREASSDMTFGGVKLDELMFDDDYYLNEKDQFDDEDDDDDDIYDDAAAADEKESTPVDAKVDADDKCKDSHELCGFWAGSGECDKNPNYMKNNCKKACNTCKKEIDSMTSRQMRESEEKGLIAMTRDYGVQQRVEGDRKDKSMLQVRKTLDYMKNYIHAKRPTHRLSAQIIEACTNNHELCAFWAAIGECEANISFMQTKCAPSCQSCSQIDFDARCPKRAADAVPGLKPGELNLMFERIVNTAPGNQTEETQIFAKEKKVQDDGTPFYTVQVHSRPESPAEVADENGVIAIDAKKDREEAPWVITFDNFLTDEECDHLIQLGYKNGYERSKDVGTKTADGSFSSKESSTRTSENAWCSDKNDCRGDNISDRVRERIANVTQIPSVNFEDFQMLKYEEGQFYRTHHDYIPHQRDRACGPRILTFFLYLSDVEEGGGTGLGEINGGLVVGPKKGKALLWPSVMNYDPSSKESRTTHEAISVGKGTKFAANSWIHLYDVVETQKRGCT